MEGTIITIIIICFFSFLVYKIIRIFQIEKKAKKCRKDMTIGEKVYIQPIKGYGIDGEILNINENEIEIKIKYPIHLVYPKRVYEK